MERILRVNSPPAVARLGKSLQRVHFKFSYLKYRVFIAQLETQLKQEAQLPQRPHDTLCH